MGSTTSNSVSSDLERDSQMSQALTSDFLSWSGSSEPKNLQVYISGKQVNSGHITENLFSLHHSFLILVQEGSVHCLT